MLHKFSKVCGFHIAATDGGIGHVDDFLVDEDLSVRYLVVDTSNWIGGKWVLIASAAVEKIDSANEQIHVKLSREEIKLSPTIDVADIDPVERVPSFFII